MVPVPLSGFWDSLSEITAPLVQAGSIRLATSNLPAGTTAGYDPAGNLNVGTLGYPGFQVSPSGGNGSLVLIAAVVAGFLLLGNRKGRG